MFDIASRLTKFPGYVNARKPQDCFVFFDDFIGFDGNATAELSHWLSTSTGNTLAVMDGTDSAEALAGGILVFTPATAAEVENIQVQGEAFHLSDGYPLYFEARFKTSDVSDAIFMIGLSQTDATVYGSLLNSVLFVSDEDAALDFRTTNTTTKELAAVVTLVDDTWIRVAFFWDGDDLLEIFADTDDDGDFSRVGTLKASVAADYIPQATMLTPTIEHVAGASATATFSVDYIFVAQQRYPASGN